MDLHLYDLYSYSTKHNEANGWNNTDSADDSRSWNCGYEGPTNNEEIMDLRFRMIKIPAPFLCAARGPPCSLAGDEFGNAVWKQQFLLPG